MQVHLDIEDGRKAGSSFTHVGEFWRLVDGECVGAGKLDEEQVVLNEVVTKCRFDKQTVCHRVGEGMLGIGAPLGGRRRLQTLEEAHGFLLGLLPRQLIQHLHSTSSSNIYIRNVCSLQALCHSTRTPASSAARDRNRSAIKPKISLQREAQQVAAGSAIGFI